MSRKAELPNNLVPLMTRLPAELHTQLVNEAQSQHRSLNSEIVVLLELAFEAKKYFDKISLSDHLVSSAAGMKQD